MDTKKISKPEERKKEPNVYRRDSRSGKFIEQSDKKSYQPTDQLDTSNPPKDKGNDNKK